MDDEKLLKMVNSGDDDALIYIIEKYSKLLWVIVGNILNGVGTVEDIEECISDTFMNFWNKPKSFNTSKGSLKTFLSVIARRRALDRYKQLTKNMTVELHEEMSKQEDDLFEFISKRELYNELYEAIRLLGEPDKEILIRRYIFEEKPAYIAYKTNIPTKEVKNRLYRSKLKLQKILSEAGV